MGVLSDQKKNEIDNWLSSALNKASSIDILPGQVCYFNALRIASPTGPADAGFWPVIKRPSTTTSHLRCAYIQGNFYK